MANNLNKSENKKVTKLFIYGFYNNTKKELHDVPYSYGFDIVKETEDYYVIIRRKKEIKVFKKDLCSKNRNEYYLEIPKDHLELLNDYSTYLRLQKKFR